jgi:RNA polymerase sigma-70 factor, ECF subfamily
MSQSSKPNLIQRAVQGDAEAISELLMCHGPNVQRCLRVEAPWQSLIDPEDVMQVTYLEAFLQMGRFDATRPASFEAWLARIAENNLRDAIRGLQRQKQPSPLRRVAFPGGVDSVSALYEVLGVTSTTPSRVIETKELHAHMLGAIDQLPDDYASAVTLYDLEGLEISEVAMRMGRTTGAVHMLRARAHDRLREYFGTPSEVFSNRP